MGDRAANNVEEWASFTIGGGFRSPLLGLKTGADERAEMGCVGWLNRFVGLGCFGCFGFAGFCRAGSILTRPRLPLSLVVASLVLLLMMTGLLLRCCGLLVALAR